jgi:hypothetical protein
MYLTISNLLKAGLHEVYIIPGNMLESGEAAYTNFELVIGVFNWTVTALTSWIKEDLSE